MNQQRVRADLDVDVDVLIVGAGVSGLHQLYALREAGFRVRLIERGSGVGGTWFWNRYPGARFDSESYSYGYFVSPELYRDWEWSEHFAGQPEIERYLNHVVDRFALREHLQLSSAVTGAIWDERSATWTVQVESGDDVRCRFLIATTGRLSVPYFPAVAGRETFGGLSLHTGLWPKDPVEVEGKRVAVVGTGSSGSQIIPVITPSVTSLTVYQRTANWATPLNNAPITPEEQVSLRDAYESLREHLRTSDTGFLHTPYDRATFDDDAQERRAFYERVWAAKGFAKLSGNYRDLLSNPAANAEFAAFIEEKVRAIVDDPETADKLIPRNHGFGHKRPPFVTGFYEAFNDPRVSLVDLATTPILRVTQDGIETTDGHREFDIIVWATGFDFGTGALRALGVCGRDELKLSDHWHNGPVTFLGLQSAGFPNFFFPGGPHGSPGNVPRAVGDMIDFVSGLLVYARDHGYRVVETTPQAAAGWTRAIDERAAALPGADHNYAFGSNIPGKPRKFLVNPFPRADYQAALAQSIASEYRDGFIFSAAKP